MSAVQADLALIEHAHQVGELECGRRAAQRLLATQLPSDVEAVVRSFRALYTPLLGEIGPIELRRIDIKPAKVGWSLFNPTLLVHNGRLCGIVRSSNYRIVGGLYRMPQEDGNTVRTQNIYVEYSADLQITQAQPLYGPDYPQADFNVVGLEDCRLYSENDQLRVSATVRDHAGFDSRCRIATAAVDTKNFLFTDLQIQETPGKQHEKNWMPILGQKCWLYNCNKQGQTEIVTNAAGPWAVAQVGPAPQFTTGFRGGSQLVPYGAGYLATVHEVSHIKGARCYEHRLVWFDEYLRIRQCSQPFWFRSKQQIEFAAGLAVLRDHVVISFGSNDRTAWLAILPRYHVDKLLESVS